jgi:hypothetical protein
LRDFPNFMNNFKNKEVETDFNDIFFAGLPDDLHEKLALADFEMKLQTTSVREFSVCYCVMEVCSANEPYSL